MREDRASSPPRTTRLVEHLGQFCHLASALLAEVGRTFRISTGSGESSVTSMTHPAEPITWWEINIVLLISDFNFHINRDPLLPAEGRNFYTVHMLFIFHFG